MDWYFFVIFSPQYFSLAQGHGDNYGSKILTNRSLLPLKGISNIQIFTRIAQKQMKLLPPTEWEGVLRYNKSTENVRVRCQGQVLGLGVRVRCEG